VTTTAASPTPTSDDGTLRVLVLGGTGATGRLLVRQLLERGYAVSAIVRSVERVPEAVRAHPQLDLVVGSALTLPQADLTALVSRCDAIASCLGHRISLGGLFGPPWRLVTHSLRRVCAAVDRDASPPVRVVLMGSAGVRAPGEAVGLGHRIAVGLLRLLIPPHADNEAAAALLRRLPADAPLRWVVVRPDGLYDREQPAEPVFHPAPTRSAIFDPGHTSRATVAQVMADLATGEDRWREWAGRMPVVYDRET